MWRKIWTDSDWTIIICTILLVGIGLTAKKKKNKGLYVPYAIGTYLAKRGCHFPTLVQTRSGSKGLEVLLRSQLFGGQSSAGKAPLVVKRIFSSFAVVLIVS